MTSTMIRCPNEILLEIILRIPNADLDNFTSTCKTIRCLAASLIRKHRERKRLYAKIVYGDPGRNNPNTTWYHPTLMLRDLLRDDMLCYPTELFIGDRNYEDVDWDDGDDGEGSSKVHDALGSFHEDVEPLMRPIPYLNGDITLASGILNEGDIGATLGLLLNLLPNLTALKIIDYNVNSQGMRNLKQVLDGMLAKCNECSSVAERGSAVPLNKLRHVTFTRSARVMMDDEWNLSTWAPLFYLPSMRSVRAEYVIADEETWHYPGLRSKVEKLVLLHANVGIGSLDTYLKDIENLQHFEFHYDLSSMDAGYILRHVMHKLLVYAGHSLCYLELGGGSIEAQYARAADLFIRSLKSFQCLETIRLESGMFIEPAQPEEGTAGQVTAGYARKLIDLLPKSAIRVVFQETTGVGKDLVGSMLHSLPESKVDLLPNLRSITFDSNMSLGELRGSVLLKACKESGVEVSDQHGPLN
ncbi:MAG: hypothetical protein Q9213_002202 [Squamulea squamosa]